MEIKTGSSAWKTPTAPCPYCGAECDAEWANVGVGMVKAGPYRCENCGAYEIGPCDDVTVAFPDIPWNIAVKYQNHPVTEKTRRLTKREAETGWYEPLKEGETPPKNPRCPFEAGSIDCLSVTWVDAGKLCMACAWWDAQAPKEDE